MEGNQHGTEESHRGKAMKTSHDYSNEWNTERLALDEEGNVKDAREQLVGWIQFAIVRNDANEDQYNAAFRLLEYLDKRYVSLVEKNKPTGKKIRTS